MACEYIYKGTTYSSKEEFISKVIPTLQDKTLSNPVTKNINLKQVEQDFDNYNEHPDVDYYLKGNIGKITDSTLTNLCDVTANICITYLYNKGINVLQKAFHIYPTLKIANFEGDFVNHKVAISYINNKMYIFDMPQNEYITLNREGKAVFGEFKPRFIEVTPENMKKYYGIDEKSYNNTFYGNTASRYIGNAQTQVLYKNKEYINFQGNINDYFKQGSPTWSESDFKRKFFNKEDIKPTFTFNQLQDYTGNSFLHLLSRDNNWVTFFIKSIIQDSAKKGYEKVLFPRLDTIIQIESAGKFKTYEEASSYYNNSTNWIQKEKELDEEIEEIKKDIESIKKSDKNEYPYGNKILTKQEELERQNSYLIKAKEERASNRPTLLNTAKFYENDVTNILKRQGYNPVLITDEYGNTWNEIEVKEKHSEAFYLQPMNGEDLIHSDIGLRKNKEYSRQQVQNLQQLLKKHNEAKNTKHYLEVQQVGQADLFKVKVIRNHGRPVNPEVNNALLLGKKENTIGNVLKGIIANPSSKYMKELATQLLAMLPESALNQKVQVGYMQDAGIYDENLLEITINDSLENLDQAQRTFLHEAAHALTVREYKNNPEFKAKIDSLLREARKQMDTKTFAYQLSSGEEFIAGIFNSVNQFTTELAKTKGTSNKSPNLLRQFLNWVKDLLNIKGASLLDNLLFEIEDISNTLKQREAQIESGQMELFAEPGGFPDEVHKVYPQPLESTPTPSTDSKLVNTIKAAKLVFKNRQKELETQYGPSAVGTRQSLKRIEAALDKLTWASAYSDILSVAAAQLDVVHNILDKDYSEISNTDLIDARKILYFTKEFDKLLAEATEEEGLASRTAKVRSDSVKLSVKFDKLVKQRVVDASKHYGTPITLEELEAAYEDVTSLAAKHTSLETTHIPHLQFAATLMNWRINQTAEELNAFDKEFRDLVKKYGEGEFKKIFDATGRLISMYSHEFYAKETELRAAIKNAESPMERKLAQDALNDHFEQNYTYSLTPEGQALYEKHLEEITQASKFDGEVDQDAVEKFKQQYHWSTKGKVNPDGSFTITQDGVGKATIGSETIYGNNWHAYLTRTPLEQYKNPEFEKVKDLEAYNWYVDKVQDILNKIPRNMTIELGMYDRAIQQITLNMTESKFSLDNTLKGIKNGATDWFKVGLTLSQLTGDTGLLTDEKGRPKPLVRPGTIENIQKKFQYNDPIELLRKAYDMAVTYEHMLEIQPVMDIVGDLLENTHKKETNPITKAVRRDLNKDPATTAGQLINAIEMFKYRERHALTGQSRTDEQSGLLSSVEPEEIAQLEKERAEWVKNGMIGDEPKLQRFSWIKMGDALIDWTRLNLIGLRPLGAATNYIMGTLNNYIYASRDKDFNTKDLDWAFLKLRHSMGKFLSGGMLKNKETLKIGSLALKFGVVDDSFIEDASAYGKEAFFKKITEVLFKLQSSGEYLIANQLMLAKMHNTKITNLTGKEKTLYDAFDEFGDWNAKEFGEAPEWKKLVYLDKEGLNVSKLSKFRKELDQVRHRTQGDYTNPMMAKGKIFGRAYMIFRTWLPRAIQERFGSENKYTNSKGRLITVGQGFSKAAKQDGYLKGSLFKYIGGGTLVTLAKLTNLPIIGEHIAENPLAKGAVKSYEEYLKSIGMSELDVENMRAQIAEIRTILLISILALVLKGLAGDGDDDKELNFTLNTLQRTYQDLTFFVFPSSAFAIIKNPIPMMKTIQDATEALSATYNLITDPSRDTYKKTFRKGRSKTVKEWNDLIPVLSAWSTTESTLDQVFNADAYKYVNK